MPTEPDPKRRESRVKEIFARAWELDSAEERRRYLEEACGEDRELRQTVESLLEAHESSGTFLSRDVSGEKLDCSTEGPGTVIGRYRLLERLGEGGFGEVYRAGQTEPVKRQVALKIIKAGMDTKEVIARFEAERQALALMNHPNIARVLDAGTTGPDESKFKNQNSKIDIGRPYFVMELACGEPITKYCDSHRLPLGERLKLFQQVSGAVQHAHQKGIIHRDLKPSNIVVTLQEGQPVPKIIDFGIAKSLQGRLTDRTVVTCREVLLGTPAYMSPEQVGLASEDLDTRTDVYSLGVLLYELVAGVTPFESDTLRNAALVEVRRIVREVEPPKPSTRVHALGAKATEIAERRNIEPLMFERTLRGDLDWIVMKAIEKDRGRRYDSAAELANELERHLRHEPVHAGPPKATYRARKFIRRHRVGVGVTAAGAAALVIGLGVSLIGFAEAKRAQNRAKTEAAIAKAVNEFLQQDLLVQASPWSGPDRDVKVRTLLDRAAANLDTRFQDQPLVEAQIRLTLFHTYQNLGEFSNARVHLDRALEIYEERLSPEDATRLSAQGYAATLLRSEGRYRESQILLEQLLPVHRRVWGPEHPNTLITMGNLAETYLTQGKLAEAQKLNEEVLAVRRRVLGPEHPATLLTMGYLANTFQEQGRLAEAQKLNEEVLAVRRRVLGPEHPETLAAMGNLAGTIQDQGKLAEAQRIYEEVLTAMRRVLGPEHMGTLATMGNLATTFQDQGKLSEAQKLNEEVLAAQRRVLGPEHPETLGTMYNLAGTYYREGKMAEAQKLFEEVLPLRRRVLGPEHPKTLRTVGNLANACYGQGKLAEAQKLNEEVLAAQRRVLGPEHPETLATMGNLGTTFQAQGKLAQAQKINEEVMAAQRRVLGPGHQDTLRTMYNLAATYENQGKLAQAQKLFEEALLLRRRVLGPEHPDALDTMSRLAGTFGEQGQWAEAESIYRELVAVQRRTLGDEHLSVADSLANLAIVLHAQTRHEEAQSLNHDALAMRKRLWIDAAEAGEEEALNKLAWLLATCDDATILDGPRAIRYAERAVEATDRTNANYLDTLAAACAEAGRFTNAVRIQEEALALLQNGGEDLAYRLRLYESRAAYREGAFEELHSLGHALLDQGKQAEADAIFRQGLSLQRDTLGNEHPDLARTLNCLARVLGEQGRLAEAQGLFEELLALQRRVLGPEHPETLAAMGNLANTYSRQGKMAEAQRLFEEVLPLQRRVLGPEHPDTLATMNNLAWNWATCSDPEVRDGQRALDYAEQIAAATGRTKANYLDTLAAACAETGHFTNAVRVQQEAIALLDTEQKRKGYRTRLRLYQSGRACRDAYKPVISRLRAQGRLDEVEALQREQLAMRRVMFDQNHPSVADSLSELTLTLLAQGKCAAAEPLIRECLEIRENKMPKDWRTFHTRCLVGASLLGQKKFAEAELLLLSGYEGMKQREAQIPEANKVRLREALDRLVRLYTDWDKPDQAAEWQQKLTESGPATDSR